MKVQMKIRLIIDIGMTILLLFLMGYPFWGNVLHEWAGTIMFVLFILHHIMNKNWYRNIFKSRVTLFRFVQILCDILLILVMLGLMISGIWLSNHVFSFLPIHTSLSVARKLHMVFVYWGYVLISVHLGMHWGMIVNRFKSHQNTKWLFVISMLIAIYGAYVFMDRNFISYMTMNTEFVFFDFSESIFKFYFDYLALMGLWIFVSYYGMRRKV